MHRSKQPLCLWLWAAYLMVTDKRGISAVQLQKQLGIKRYETAFNMLHKLRAAMVNPDRDLLRGTVEVDETYVGGPVAGARGRSTTKAIVIGAVELRDGRPTRVRFQKISSVGASAVLKFVTDTVERGSEVITDGSPSYNGLYEAGYVHRVQSTGMLGDDPDAVLPHFHRAVSNMKTWLLGTHHGRVSQKHLQAYLNEFAFRYNRRGNLQAAFQTILGLTAKSEGPTYKGLYRGTYQHKNPQPPSRAKVQSLGGGVE
ncbi:MAG: IS1595 family transposase [Chloroflexi bacterium]|nr:IS1595 family transposase [Chloroflexota bacterium]MDA1296739.1 IS1595 family transposase [Chloroflexota bacterium]